MSIVFGQGYTAYNHHLLLDHIKKGKNNAAKLLVQKLHNSSVPSKSIEAILIHSSVKWKNTDMVQYLLVVGCDVNAQDKYGNTPLMPATANMNVDIVKLLLKNNADIYLTNPDGISSLQLAIRSRGKSQPFHSLHLESHYIVEMFFEKVNEDFVKNKQRVTNLLKKADKSDTFVIVVFGSIELTKYILGRGYEVNYRDPTRNCTALHWAIIFAKIEKAILLINYGADVHKDIEFVKSPLSCYTHNCEAVDEKSEFLKRILKFGTNFNALNKLGLRTLMSLFEYGNNNTAKTVLEYLLKSGVNLFADSRENRCILDYVMKNKNNEVFETIDEFAIDFDINSRDFKGETALIRAARLGSLKIVEFLLNSDADTNLTSYSGESALYYSVKNADFSNDRVNMIEVLLQHNADAQIKCAGILLINHCLSFSREIIIPHLAILGSIGKLKDPTRREIESKSSLRIEFWNCTRKLQELEKIVVHGKITLFKLLTEDEKTLITYARDQEFIPTCNMKMKTFFDHNKAYYLRLISEKITKVLHKIEVNKKAALIIEELTGIGSDVYHIIVYKIIGYLNLRDLNRLCKIENSVPMAE